MYGDREKQRAPSEPVAGKGEKPRDTHKSWERKKPILCHFCRLPGHYKVNCAEYKKTQTQGVNNIAAEFDMKECFKPFVSQMKINGVERDCLRDSGSNLDVCSANWIDANDLLGEIIWVRQPLDHEFKCLPLAKVKISGEFGEVITKVAVKPKELEEGLYLLGNYTANLIEEKRKKIKNFSHINAVETRAQAIVRREEKKPAEQLIFTGEAESASNQLVEKGVKEKPAPERPVALLSESEEPLNFPDAGEQVVRANSLSAVLAEDFEREQKECLSLKSLWEKANSDKETEFGVLKGKLIRTCAPKRKEKRIQLCVPLVFQEKILKSCHEDVSGHLGVKKTKDRVLRHFFWPNVYAQVEKFVQSCDACQRIGKKGDKKKAPLCLVPIISEVFSKINIDAVGPLQVSSNNNKYLITAICMASKYPEAIAVPDITSPSVIKALMTVFSRVGFPREIQSDLGKSFTSILTEDFFERFGIKVTHSSVCHPQSNVVERLHASLKRVLKVLCLESKEDWEENLPAALFAFRTVTHESTGFSPAELVYGKNLRTPQTLLYEKWTEQESTDPNVVEYITDLVNRLKKWREVAREVSEEARDKRKTYYDRNAVSRDFKVGDKVLVLATSKPHKMSVSWMGPGEITEKISDTNYLVDLPGKRDKTVIYHVNLLKPYYHRSEWVNMILESPVEEIEREAQIPYPTAESTHFDMEEVIRDSGLERRLTEDQIGKLRRVLRKHNRVFSTDPGTTHLIEMDIELTSSEPVRSKPYRMSPRQTEILREEINRLLKLGVIEIGQSDYTSPMILVEVPGKDPRPCVDYRRLNAITKNEYFPLPNIEELVERVSASSFITVMDLTKGYFQIPLTKRAQRYATFVTPFGSYRPLKMMFGLKGAPFVFCQLMSMVLQGLEQYADPYIDDVACHSLVWESHLKELDSVLSRIGEAGLTIKPSKCKFAQDHVMFLGHEVGSGKRAPNEIKIKAIQEFPTPSNKTQIRAFLGLCGYYSRYVSKFSVVAVPLTNALKGREKREKIEWTAECEQAFQELKAKLITKPVLYAPDFKEPFIVQTDASGEGAGIVLAQVKEGEEHPILYLSKKFSQAEKNYSTIERELAAIVFGLKKLNYYLDGQKFKIQCDHNPLKYLDKMLGTNARLTRWALCLQQYQYEIEHKPGKQNGNADGLSRLFK